MKRRLRAGDVVIRFMMVCGLATFLIGCSEIVKSSERYVDASSDVQKDASARSLKIVQKFGDSSAQAAVAKSAYVELKNSSEAASKLLWQRLNAEATSEVVLAAYESLQKASLTYDNAMKPVEGNLTQSAGAILELVGLVVDIGKLIVDEIKDAKAADVIEAAENVRKSYPWPDLRKP